MQYLNSNRKANKDYLVNEQQLEELFNENEEDINKIKANTDYVHSGNNRPKNLIETIQAFLRDMQVDGYVLKYPHGVVIRQGERRNYYRGEAEDYPTSKTSLHRELDNCKNDDEKQVVKIVARMRFILFRNFLQRIRYVKEWEQTFGIPYYEAIAQHYGFLTEYLDITNDFNVAMFFACCIWDKDKKEWRPLTKTECEEKKEGVLYHAPATNVMLSVDADGQPVPYVMPIGYQPFYRCQKQVGYVKYMKEGEDFKDDLIFEKLKFKHSENLSNGIFHYMREGRDIYPDEALLYFDEEIEALQQTLSFSTDVFDKAIEELELNDKRDELLRIIKTADFCVGNHLYRNIEIEDGLVSVHIARQKINRFNLKNEGRSPEKDNGIKLSSRLCCKF